MRIVKGSKPKCSKLVTLKCGHRHFSPVILLWGVKLFGMKEVCLKNSFVLGLLSVLLHLCCCNVCRRQAFAQLGQLLVMWQQAHKQGTLSDPLNITRTLVFGPTSSCFNRKYVNKEDKAVFKLFYMSFREYRNITLELSIFLYFYCIFIVSLVYFFSF